MKEAKFYCDCCGETSMFLKAEYECPFCGHELFDSEEELREYIDYPEVNYKVPFDKPKRGKESGD